MNKEDVVHINNGLLLSHKKNEIVPSAATWMDLAIIILSELSQTEKDKYHKISLTYGIFFFFFYMYNIFFIVDDDDY